MEWPVLFWYMSVFRSYCCSVVSNSLQPHELHHTSLPRPSLSPRVYSNSVSIDWVILFSVAPFSSCLQSFPASGSFPVSQLFASGVQNIGTSASTSVILMNIQDCFPLELTGWISLLSKGLSRVFSNSSKASIPGCSALFIVPLSHLYMTTGKTIALTLQAFVSKVKSLLFNTLSRFFIAFLPGIKCLLISWLQSPSAVIFGAQENKVCHCFQFFLSICHKVVGPDASILVF